MGNRISRKHAESAPPPTPTSKDLAILKAAAPWQPIRVVRQLSAHKTSQYYKQIWKDDEALDDIQRTCLLNNAADIRSAARRRRQGRLASEPGFQLAKYGWNVSTNLVKTFLNQPLLPFTDPINTLFTVSAFVIMFGFLFVFNLVLTIGHYCGFGMLFGTMKNLLVDIADKDMFRRGVYIFDHAIPVLAQGPPKDPAAKLDPLNQPRKTKKEPTICNLDVCKAMLLLCTLVYERQEDFVKLALDYPAGAVKYLMRSEEQMYFWARVYGLKFVACTDFGTGKGSFCGIFYKIDGLAPGQAPFCVVCFKGTTPWSISEWIVDASFALEDCGDWLATGTAHQGFYRNCFPQPSPDMRVIPYRQIIDAVKLVASESAKKNIIDGKGPKLQVYVTGHSLGAGQASLFAARLLESPNDLGKQCDFRQAFLFGTPRSVSAQTAARVEHNLLRPENADKTIFRICNFNNSQKIGDIVCSIPPGLSDDRSNRSTVKPGSLLSYSHIGTEVSLRPHGVSPFWTTADKNNVKMVQTGRIDYGFKLVADKSFEEQKKHPLKSVMRLLGKLCGPGLDHAPASYLDSLDAVDVEKIEKEMARALEGLDDGPETIPSAAASPKTKTKQVTPSPELPFATLAPAE